VPFIRSHDLCAPLRQLHIVVISSSIPLFLASVRFFFFFFLFSSLLRPCAAPPPRFAAALSPVRDFSVYITSALLCAVSGCAVLCCAFVSFVRCALASLLLFVTRDCVTTCLPLVVGTFCFIQRRARARRAALGSECA
jgi:hypothetical protein